MHEIKLPQLGQSVEEAAVTQWFKHEGDTVAAGDALFAIQTDKAEIECESTAAGVSRKILVQPDVMVPVMTVVALVGDAGEPLPDLSRYAVGGSAAAPSAEAAPVAETPAPAMPTPTTTTAPSGTAPASPRARRKAQELGVDVTQVVGTGVGGRIMEEDVVAYAAAHPATKATPTAKRVAQNEGIDLAQVAGSGPHGKIMKADVQAAMQSNVPAPKGAVPLSPMRRIIAQRMVESKFTAPHYYVTVEVDMAAAKSLREKPKGFKPSYNDIVMLATVKAIRQHPAVNARWFGDAIELVDEVNLGFAVALPQGLIVPVVKRAHQMSLEGISDATRALSEKARTGKLLPDDYQGNTFTISNLGAFGVDHFTAIINQPDSAILAVGQIKDRVVVIDGGMHIRPIMKLTLSSDHRVIDGAVAAQFMGTLKQILEEGAF
jgi:pyruvate dehydrogenase E2 component (dihydrolipoamide acetyltransferase)